MSDDCPKLRLDTGIRTPLNKKEPLSNEPSLKTIPTDKLKDELKSRGELCPILDDMELPICLMVTTTKSLVNELVKREGVECLDVNLDQCYSVYIGEQKNIQFFGSATHGEGPAKIIVVKG